VRPAAAPTAEAVMIQIIIALLCIVVAFLLIWMVLRVFDSGGLNLGLAGVIVREEQPVSFWFLLIGLVAVVVLLLMLAAVLFVEGRSPP
jgi:hypothetical protein